MSLSNAYDAKIIKGYPINALTLSIEKATLLKPIEPNTLGIINITEDHDVNPFVYPIFDKEKGMLYVDARPYSSVQRDGTLKIRNTLDESVYNLLAVLERSWVLSDRPDAAARAFNVSSEVMVRWLSGTISHRYGLNPQQRSKVMSLTGMFSIGQFYNNIEDSLTVSRHLQSISRKYPVNETDLNEVAAQLDNNFPRDVDEYVAALGKIELGTRLSDFSTKSLYALLGGAWWGNVNNSILSAVALEYPPAMAALVQTAIQNTMLKRTGIGTTVYDMKSGSVFDTHLRAVAMFIDQYS